MEYASYKYSDLAKKYDNFTAPAYEIHLGGMTLRSDQSKIASLEVELAADVEAPVEPGQILGRLSVRVDGEERQNLPLVADQGVARISLGGIFSNLLQRLLMVA